MQSIPRASALRLLLSAFHLSDTERFFAAQTHLRYTYFMDDSLIQTRPRHHPGRTVQAVNGFLAQYRFIRHPDKTFTGRLKKGTDWMGAQQDDSGGGPPRVVSNILQKLHQLYEQT